MIEAGSVELIPSLNHQSIIKMNIEIISGSPRENSVTHRVALFLKKLLNEKTAHTVNIIDSREGDLPLVQHGFVSVDATPEEVKPFSKGMFGAHAFIVVCAE